MNITQVTPDQLEITNKGTAMIGLGILFLAIGIAVSVSPLFAPAADWWNALIGVGVMALGVLLALSAKNKSIVLNRTTTSTITESKVIGGAVTTTSFEPSQVASVRLETRTQYVDESTSLGTTSSLGSRKERVSTLTLVLRDTSEVPIASARSGKLGIIVGGINVASFGKTPLSDEAANLATFFNVPLAQA